MAAISTGIDSCGEFADCEKVVLPILCGLTTAAIARGVSKTEPVPVEDIFVRRTGTAPTGKSPLRDTTFTIARAVSKIEQVPVEDISVRRTGGARTGG